MHFLIDASMPRSAADLIRGRGCLATDVRDIGLGGAADELIASQAKNHQQIILTRDFHFADVRNYPPDQYAGIVVFDLPNSATATTILKWLDRFLAQTQTLQNLPARLAIVEAGRIRMRPAP